MYIEVVLADSATRLRTSFTWIRIRQEVSCCQPSNVLVTFHSATDVMLKKHSVKWERNSLPALG